MNNRPRRRIGDTRREIKGVRAVHVAIRVARVMRFALDNLRAGMLSVIGRKLVQSSSKDRYRAIKGDQRGRQLLVNEHVHGKKSARKK
jgi:hypothetical protein